MRYRVSRPADRDLDQIWLHIAADDRDAADRVDEALHSAMKMLARFPGIGHRRAEVKDPRYRFWKVYSYLIAYRVERSTLIVVRPRPAEPVPPAQLTGPVFPARIRERRRGETPIRLQWASPGGFLPSPPVALSSTPLFRFRHS